MRTIQEQNTLSIVIPTLDAAAELPACLASFAGSLLIREIVVADGGSRDATTGIARAAGATVVMAPRGRGTQLAAGAAAASGEWLLLLHADCRLQSGWEEVVGAFIAGRDATGRAAYFSLALDDDASAARLLERLVAWRCRLLALPYGDQGLVIARALYDAVGGFAAIPLMEDVDLVRRLGRKRLVRLDAAVLASARRYRRDGYIRRSIRHLLCLGLYFAGVTPRRIARLYG